MANKVWRIGAIMLATSAMTGCRLCDSYCDRQRDRCASQCAPHYQPSNYCVPQPVYPQPVAANSAQAQYPPGVSYCP